jgi:hypothetical protein
VISDRERAEVRAQWPKPSLMFRLLAELEAAEAKGWCPCADNRPQHCQPEDWPASDLHGWPARLRKLVVENTELRAKATDPWASDERDRQSAKVAEVWDEGYRLGWVDGSRSPSVKPAPNPYR